MKFESTLIAGVYVGQRTDASDHRGEFSRLFCPRELIQADFKNPIVQVNKSKNYKAGTLRGMHYQRTPFAEKKIISCLRGKIFDVAVDLRKGSPTFLKWTSVLLSDKQKNMIVIPEGCAHGFQTLEDNCELLYFHSNFYQAEAEAGLRYDDPRLKIQWPVPLSEISERDKDFLWLENNFEGLSL